MSSNQFNPLLPIEVEIVPQPHRIKPRPVRVFAPPEGIPFVNDSGETIPAYAVLQPDGWILPEDEDGTWLLEVRKPSTAPTDVYFLNGPREVEKDGTDRTATFPAFALWFSQTLTSPALLDRIAGAKPAEWKINLQVAVSSRTVGGFTCLSLPTSDPKRLLVAPVAPAAYCTKIAGGQVQTGVTAGYTKLTILLTIISRHGMDASTVTHDFTVERDGAYQFCFTATVRFNVFGNSGTPIFAVFKNGVIMTPSIKAEVELNYGNYRPASFCGQAKLSAGDVIDVRVQGSVGQELRFQMCQFSVHLVA